ncbi:MAG: peroxiredoxin family protein [Phycisphaerae bacterium]
MTNNELKVGDAAPDFELMNQDKQPVKLADLRGKKVVLLFYPMDFSPVCTAEHCAFAAATDQIAADADTVIFGINCDHAFSHEAFKKQFNIPYDLLSDTSRDTVKAYGMYAGLEPFNCSKRGTVVIDTQGKVAHYEAVEIGEARTVEAIAKAALA